jgi:small subunit ribosomal protein S27Ae
MKEKIEVEKVPERSENKVRKEKQHKEMKPRFNIVEDKLVKNRPYCRRCGAGVMMAEMGEFYVCGKCGLRENKLLHVHAKI